MKREIISKRLPKTLFLIRSMRLEPKIRKEVSNFIYFNEENIDHYEFGRIPRHRAYRIFMCDGAIVEWNVTR